MLSRMRDRFPDSRTGTATGLTDAKMPEEAAAGSISVMVDWHKAFQENINNQTNDCHDIG